MAKRILFIHGRSFKPHKTDLWRLWLEATRFGIQRSFPRKLPAFHAARKEFVYYGDRSNRFLRGLGKRYSPRADAADRKTGLDVLKLYADHQFTKRNYSRLPGKTSLKEFFADALGRPLDWFGLSEKAIGAVAPDMREYWNPDSAFGSELRGTLTPALKRAMNSGDKILVVAHSLGTLISWDTFWKFSYMHEYQAYRRKRIDFWITMGSPLGDETVKGKLRGSRAEGSRRYPANVLRWANLAAEDDYISHDKKVKNDYKKMLRLREIPIREITDHKIYNLTVREGKSNPHSSMGYLIHPKTAELIAGWL